MKTSAVVLIAMLALGCSEPPNADDGAPPSMGQGSGVSGGGSGHGGNGSSGNGQGGAADSTTTVSAAGSTATGMAGTGTDVPEVVLNPDAGPPEPELPQPTFTSCAVPAADSTSKVQGAWTGTVHLEQNLLGATSEKDLPVELYLEERSAPRRHLAAIAYLGDGWNVTSDDPNATSLGPFIGEGGNGRLWGYNSNEADGGANELTLTDSCIEADETSFAWRYAITYHVADVVDRELYGYLEPSAPLVTLAAEELYAVIDDELHLRAESDGMTAQGQPVAFRMTGTLTRITR